MNIANKLTVLRMILMPVMAVLFYFELYITAAVVFVIAAITDMLDGKIARNRGLVTVFGKFFDPLADKLINISALILICGKLDGGAGIFVSVTTVIVVARELLVTGLRTLAAGEGAVIAADGLGKIKTVLQDIAIVALMVDLKPFAMSTIHIVIHWFALIMLVAALVLTIVSGINYFAANKTVFEKLKKDI